MREAAETLRLDYAQFLELEIFTRFGGVIDAQVKDKIARGRRIRPLEKIAEFRSELSAWLDRSMSALVDQVERSGNLDNAARFQLRAELAAIAERLAPEPNSSRPRTL